MRFLKDHKKYIGLNDYVAQPSETNDMNFCEYTVEDQVHEHETSSSLGTQTREKLPQRKKARTEPNAMRNINNEIATVTDISNQVFGMLRQRWKQEAEEKEAEEKVNKMLRRAV
ncbi:unnamed protein product [Cochlearia groenlandica]